jgi:predicted DNA-binding transcriptional regulator AlpA
MRLMRRPEMLRATGLSASSQRRLENEGLFPKKCHLSARAVAWSEEEVTTWMRARAGVDPSGTAADKGVAR